MANQDPTDSLRNVLESGRAIKLNRGVIGKTGHIALSVVFLWALIIGRWSENIVMDAGLLIVGAVATGFAIWWTRSSQDFAQRNPAQAMLEGADFLEYRKLEIQEKGGGPTVPGIPHSITIQDGKVETE